MRKFILPILAFVITNVACAQQVIKASTDNTVVTQSDAPTRPLIVRCLDMNAHELTLEKRDPTRKARRAAAETMMNNWIENQSVNRVANTETQYMIPVVFHVLWNSGNTNEKISLAQIKRQMKVTNADYNRMNADTTRTYAGFKPVATSFHINFCLAQLDPSGNPTTGVVYKQTTNTSGFSESDNGAKYPSLGGDTIWDPNKYLNIWICNLSGGLLGYSEFPTASLDNTFGSVILYQAVGDSGYLPYPAYNLGRTITHEIGHLLNLIHPWGDDGGLCPPPGPGQDDGCADTPPEGNNKHDGYGDGSGPTFGGPPSPYMDNCSTVSPGIMIENYMEYTNDSIMNMFSKDQYTRALAAINGPLASLVTSSACNGVTSTEEYNFDNYINVYPNPSYTGRFNVSIGLTNFSHINVVVFNVLGQTVASWNSDAVSNTTYDLDLSNQPNGLYFVKLFNGDYSTVKKIMINR